MRLWTIHPKYLDRMGLLGVWREGLLAQAVLQGNTKGYKNHPQLTRFKTHQDPKQAISAYLLEIYAEARRRGYNFDFKKIAQPDTTTLIQTTSGQLDFEVEHLKSKLIKRNKQDYIRLCNATNVISHPLFMIIPGKIEKWEKIMHAP